MLLIGRARRRAGGARAPARTAGWRASTGRRRASGSSAARRRGCRRRSGRSGGRVLDSVTTRASSRPSIVPIRRPGQREVAEVVGAELELEAVGGLARAAGPSRPALLISRSRPVVRRRGSARRTRAPSRGSTGRAPPARAGAPGTAASISRRAASPLARLRHASTTRAPARASSRAVTSPSPLFAPGAPRRCRPPWSGICSGRPLRVHASRSTPWR